MKPTFVSQGLILASTRPKQAASAPIAASRWRSVTAKNGVMKVQGDHVVTVMAALTKLGYAVKLSGG